MKNFYRTNILSIFIIIFLFVTFSNKVLFGEPYLEQWKELSRYGLLPPDQKDITSTKKLILLAIQTTAFKKGLWWKATGLLGTSRLPSAPEEALYSCLGYESFFGSALTKNSETKMESAANGEALLVFSPENGFKSNSWVYKREAYIAYIGYSLNARFKYNKQGNYDASPKIFYPTTDHIMSFKLNKILAEAYLFYKELSSLGFKDKTLGDAIGMANAVLVYDQINVNYDDSMLSLSATTQKYTDALNAILKDLKRGMPFFEALNLEMQSMDLQKDDVIPCLDNGAQSDVIIKLMNQDLEYIEKIARLNQTK